MKQSSSDKWNDMIWALAGSAGMVFHRDAAAERLPQPVFRYSSREKLATAGSKLVDTT